MRAATGSPRTTSPAATSIRVRRSFSKTQLLWTPVVDLGDAVHPVERARARRRLRAAATSGRCAPARSSRRATTKASPTATSSRRRSCSTAPAGRSTSRRRPGSCRGRPSDATDLDYTPLPLIDPRQRRRETCSSPRNFVRRRRATHRMAVAGDVTMRWQAGLFLFTQDYDQDAVNSFSPFVLSEFVPFPDPAAVADRRRSTIRGFGVYGRGTFQFGSRFDGTIGLRADCEHKSALARNLLRADVRAANRRRPGEELHRRVAAVHGGVSRLAVADDLRDRGTRLQGRRVQRGLPVGQRERTTPSTPGTTKWASRRCSARAASR